MKTVPISGARVWEKTEQRNSAIRQQSSVQISFVFVFSLSPLTKRGPLLKGLNNLTESFICSKLNG